MTQPSPPAPEPPEAGIVPGTPREPRRGRVRRRVESSRRTFTAVVSAAAVALVVSGGGVAFWWALYTRDQTAEPPGAGLPPMPPPAIVGDPGPSLPSAVGPTAGDRRTGELVTPAVLRGRMKVTDSDVTTTVTDLRQLLTRAGAVDTVGGAYGTTDPPDLIIVAAVAASLDNPQKELETSFAALRTSELAVTDVRPVSAGPLGGTARCGVNSPAAQQRIVVCGWADRYSSGLVVQYDTTPAQAAREFVAIRAAIQRKGG